MNKFLSKSNKYDAENCNIFIVLPALLSISPGPEAKTKPVCVDCQQTPI